MPIVHPVPTPGTAKALYGTALVCGFPDCNEPLFKETPDGSGRLLNSRMAHIAARSEGGPRWDPDMDGAENRSANNLILMCVQHADAIDLPGWETRFPTDLLLAWKAAQLAAYDAGVGGWQITDEEIAEIIQTSIESNIVLQAQVITLGGTGGNAPMASGGGGAAVGPGAIGGKGGPVGRIDLEGTSGVSPGGGGGGGGALADGAIVPDPNVRRATEGRGFSSGLDGADGGETSFGLGDKVLVRAAGGKGGLSGTGNRVTSDQLRVSTLMLANYIEHGAFVYVARGSWQSYSVLNVGTTETFPVLVIVEAGGVPPGEYTMIIRALGPDGATKAETKFPVTVEEAGDVLRISRSCALDVAIDAWGLWSITASTPLGELARIDLLVKRTGEA